MSLYNNIPQAKLRWLDGISFETGQNLLIGATGANLSWLPPEIASQIEDDKTYVMTISDSDSREVVAISKYYSGWRLIRGLEGTAPKDWPTLSRVYQSFTAHQLAYLIRKAANIPLAPSDIFGVYIGTINQSGTDYWIYAAPPDDTTNAQFKVTGTATDSYSETEGALNMQDIIAEGLSDHPAAEYCANYRGGGFEDWYLPSTGELMALQAAKPDLDVTYKREDMLSSTCVQEGGGNPSWEGQLYFVNPTGSGRVVVGLKNQDYLNLVIPFRRVLPPA